MNPFEEFIDSIKLPCVACGEKTGCSFEPSIFGHVVCERCNTETVKGIPGLKYAWRYRRKHRDIIEWLAALILGELRKEDREAQEADREAQEAGKVWGNYKDFDEWLADYRQARKAAGLPIYEPPPIKKREEVKAPPAHPFCPLTWYPVERLPRKAKGRVWGSLDYCREEECAWWYGRNADPNDNSCAILKIAASMGDDGRFKRLEP